MILIGIILKTQFLSAQSFTFCHVINDRIRAGVFLFHFIFVHLLYDTVSFEMTKESHTCLEGPIAQLVCQNLRVDEDVMHVELTLQLVFEVIMGQMHVKLMYQIKLWLLVEGCFPALSSFVPSFTMKMQVTRIIKKSVAHWTSKWLLSCVNSFVFIPATYIRKCFFTILT